MMNYHTIRRHLFANVLKGWYIKTVVSALEWLVVFPPVAVRYYFFLLLGVLTTLILITMTLPTSKPKPPTENQEQIAFIEWAKHYPTVFPYLFAIPNGGFRFVHHAALLKKTGVKKGVSDLFYARPSHDYHGLWIEMKRKTKSAKLSPEQVEWLKLMDDQRYATAVCYGADEAIKAVRDYVRVELRGA